MRDVTALRMPQKMGSCGVRRHRNPPVGLSVFTRSLAPHLVRGKLWSSKTRLVYCQVQRVLDGLLRRTPAGRRVT